MLAAPMLLPPYVVALAWIYLWTSGGFLAALVDRDVVASWTHSLPAAILVLSLVFYPLSMLASEVARRIDGRLEEAALVVAAPRRVLRRITLPLAAPSIVAAALVIFVLAVSEFGVPGLLRVRVYTTEIFTAFAALYDFSRAIVLAVPLLVLSAAVGAVAARLLGDRIVSARRLTGRHPALFDHWRREARLAVTVVIVVAVVLPIVVLAREALNVRSMRGPCRLRRGDCEQFDPLGSRGDGRRGCRRLPRLCACKSARARRHGRRHSLRCPLCCPKHDRGHRVDRFVESPGSFSALSTAQPRCSSWPIWRDSSPSQLILAAAVRHVPISHEEAAAAAGAGWLRTMRRIVLPQLRLGLAAAWIVVFVPRSASSERAC